MIRLLFCYAYQCAAFKIKIQVKQKDKARGAEQVPQRALSERRVLGGKDTPQPRSMYGAADQANAAPYNLFYSPMRTIGQARFGVG